MSEVEFRLEREDTEGIVAVGTYLSDAVKRMGGSFEGPCDQGCSEQFCAVHIVEGAEYLSSPTRAERDYLAKPGVSKDERLACQAKIEKPGRIVVMTKEKKEEQKAEDHTETFKKEFSDMPLEKKIANLVQLEAIALSETVSIVMNSPFALAGKLMDVMAEFGFKMERESKDAKRPEEHRSSENGAKAGDKKDASDGANTSAKETKA